MKKVKLLLVSAACLGAGACSNEYYERSDAIRFNTGDAVASNAAVQIPNPVPPRSHDTNIPMDGVKAQNAMQNYRKPTRDADVVVETRGNGGGFQPSINVGK